MSSEPASGAYTVIAFRDAAQFEAWLDTQVDLHVGVWLKIARKGSGVASLTDDERFVLPPVTTGKEYDRPGCACF